jgi:hypothetical protein
MDICFDIGILAQGKSIHPEAKRILVLSLSRLNRVIRPKATLKRTSVRHVQYGLPSVFHRGSNPLENDRALRILLDTLESLDLVQRKIQPSLSFLYQSGVTYARTEIWDTTSALYERGFGDCKSLSTSLCAERAAQGQKCKTVFRFMPHQTGDIAVTYHILILSAQGWECPSKVLGMGADENSYFKLTGS